MQNLGGLWILFFSRHKKAAWSLIMKDCLSTKLHIRTRNKMIGGLENLIQQQIVCFIDSRMRLTALHKLHYIYFN